MILTLIERGLPTISYTEEPRKARVGTAEVMHVREVERETL